MKHNLFKVLAAALTFSMLISSILVFAQGPAGPAGPPPGFMPVVVVINPDTLPPHGGGPTGHTNDSVIITPGTNIWTGIISNNWFVPVNWSAGKVPSSCNDTVFIPLVTTEPVLTANVTVGSIGLAAGVNINLQTYSLSICGSLSGPQSFGASMVGSGRTILNGSARQNISGELTINELVVNNTAGVQLQAGANLFIYTALDLQAGNLDVSQGVLTLQSTTVTQCAIIDNFSAGYHGTLTGAITAQRFYGSSDTYNQHFMGSPVNSPSFAQFGNVGTAGFVIPKPDCDESAMDSISPYGHVFSYHEGWPSSWGASCGVGQWKVETSGNAVNGEGYSILRVGWGTLSLRGTANLDSSYTLTGLTNSNWSNTSLQNRNMSSGWALLSNPYPATLQINTANSDVDNQIQIWDANGPFSGSYQASVVGVDAIIPPFQAFMVHVIYPGSFLNYTINASDRVRTPQQFYAQHDAQLHIVAENKQTGLLDQTTIAFDTRATDNFDPEFDAIKALGAPDRHTLYSLSNDQWMAINVLHAINTNSTVALGFLPGISGTYVFRFNDINTFKGGTGIFLEDKQVQIMYDITKGDYTFTANSADNPNRFVLHFSQGISTAISTNNPGQPEPLHMWSYENKIYVDFSALSNVHATIKIYDILGRELVNDKFEGRTIYQTELNNLSAACVIVNISNNGNSETRKLFVSGR